MKKWKRDGYVNTLQRIHEQTEEYQCLHSHFAFGTTQRYYATLLWSGNHTYIPRSLFLLIIVSTWHLSRN